MPPPPRLALGYRRTDEKSIVILSSLGMCCRHLTPDRSKSLRDAVMLVVSWYCQRRMNRGGRCDPKQGKTDFLAPV